MNESAKTITFVGAAVATAAIAVASHFMNRPTNSTDFELVGQPFYETFDSANQAQSLEVVAMDIESARLQRFSVENQEGLWRIPSHYNYPAEAASRLATTATSVMGIEREILAGRLTKEHARLGVVDPFDEENDDPESAGKRLTLKDAQGEVVVDYIIGNEAGDVVLTGADRAFGETTEKYYYVRRPDENQTYKVKLDIDLSTKFSDWIDPDLLRLEGTSLTKIDINNYSIEEDRSDPLAQSRALFKKQGDVLNLSRPTTSVPWTLAGLVPEQEELQADRINAIVAVLDQLKIAGVRPKFKFKDKLLLTADLELNQQPEFEADPRGFSAAIQQLQAELDQKGFNLAQAKEKLELVSKYGELTVGTEQGVAYTLHIGNAVEGDESEIEIGANQPDGETADAADDKAEETDAKKTDDESSDKKDDATAEAKEDEVAIDNRYLLVRVALDRSLITPQPIKPTAPVAPVQPEGYTPKPVEPEKKEGDTPADVKAPEGVEKPEGLDEDKKDDRKPEFVAHDAALQQFEDDKVRFGLDQVRFEDETKAFDKKVEEAQAIVDELNERFGEWYYVMTGDNLKTLRTERTDLVTKKEPPAGAVDPAAQPPTRPDISFPSLPPQGAGLMQDGEETPADPTEDPTKETTDSSTEAGQGEDGKPGGESEKPPSSDLEKKEAAESEPAESSVEKPAPVEDPNEAAGSGTQPVEQGSQPATKSESSGKKN